MIGRIIFSIILFAFAVISFWEFGNVWLGLGYLLLVFAFLFSDNKTEKE